MPSSSFEINIRIAVDPVFPLVELQGTGKRLPPCDILTENKFQLIFDEKVDGEKLSVYTAKKVKVKYGIILHYYRLY